MDGAPSYQAYYASIEKPFFAPPEWVFGLAWGIIYPLIAVAFICLVYLAMRSRASWWLVALFFANIVANLLFTPFQLLFPSAPWATLDILIVLGTLIALVWLSWRYSKAVVFLLVPYLLWSAFATALQITIYAVNYL